MKEANSQILLRKIGLFVPSMIDLWRRYTEVVGRPITNKIIACYEVPEVRIDSIRWDRESRSAFS